MFIRNTGVYFSILILHEYNRAFNDLNEENCLRFILLRKESTPQKMNTIHLTGNCLKLINDENYRFLSSCRDMKDKILRYNYGYACKKL